MTRRSTSLLALSAAAFLAACGGNPRPATPAPRTVEAVAVPTAATAEALSDERAMELARGYVALLHARDYDRLWQHASPEAKQRFGTVERFRSQGERALGNLGTETVIVSERVQPASEGMLADRLYLRVSRYTGADGPVRLMLGLKNDGSIVAMQLRRAE